MVRVFLSFDQAKEQATSLPEHVIIDLVEEQVVEQKVNLEDFEHVDPVQLSVYGHRLMGIAEQVCPATCEHRRALTVDGGHLAENLNIHQHQRTPRLVCFPLGSGRD